MAGLALFLAAATSGLAIAQLPGWHRLSTRLLFALAWGLALVVGGMTAAGAVGVLRPWPTVGLVALGTVASIAAAAAGVRRGRDARRLGLAEAVRGDLLGLFRAARLLRHPELAALALLAWTAWLWAASAAYWLPPRSVDDLAHHLTPVWEAAARGRFALTLLDLLPWLAYPLNADLLSLWPSLLSGSIRWADGAQLVTGPIACLAAFTIGRLAGASARSAAAPALALALTPLFARQASSAYTDLTVAAYFGIAATGALAAARGGGCGALLLFGIGAGLLAGTKYNLLFAVALLVPVAARGFFAMAGVEARLRAALAAVVPALALGGYWYVRNGIELANPFYPYSASVGPLTLFAGSLPTASELAGSPPFFVDAVRHPATLAALVFGDAGSGGIDGGLGPIFWGAILPLGLAALARCAWDAAARRATDRLEPALLFLAGLVPFLVMHAATYSYAARFLVLAAVAGSCFFALGLDRLAAIPTAAGAARAGLVLISGLSVLPTGGQESRVENKQWMRVGAAAAAERSGSGVSPWRAIFGAEFGVGRTAPAWDLLDVLSVPHGAKAIPLWVYTTGQYPAPVFGSRLISRIWNSGDPARPRTPDALLYYLPPLGGEEKIQYGGDRDYPLAAVARDPDRYELVLAAPYVLVYLDRARLAPGRDERSRLAAYYERAVGPWVSLARSLDHVPERGVIVATSAIGMGLKARELRDELPLRVVLSRPEDVNGAIRRYAAEGPVYLASEPGRSRAPVVGRMVSGPAEVLLQRVDRELP